MQEVDASFGIGIALEVAEHLPKEHEETFLDNLIGIAKDDGWIILSWAKKGHGGLGHVNEQNEDYVLLQRWLKKDGLVKNKRQLN